MDTPPQSLPRHKAKSVECVWHCLQNNATNAYYLNGTTLNNNNKSNTNIAVPFAPYDESVKHIITLESLFEAFYNCCKNKRGNSQCIRFSMNLEENVIKLWSEILTGTYEISESLAFIVNYPVKREIFAAHFRDRVVHHWVAMRIEPLLEKLFINDSYNCRKGKGTSYGIERTKQMYNSVMEQYGGDAYGLKLDIEGFFMSIDKNILWGMLERFINENYHEADKETLCYLTKMIVFHNPAEHFFMGCPWEEWYGLPKSKSLFYVGKDKGVAIGNLTAQLFANFYLAYMDINIKKLFSNYGRYVDDMSLMGRAEQLKAMCKTINNELAPLGLRTHRRKFYLQPLYNGFPFIGAMLKPNRTYISKRTVGRAYSKIMWMNGWEDKRGNLAKFSSSINSYFGIMRRFASYNVKKRLASAIDDEWYEYGYFTKNYKKFKINSKTKRLCKKELLRQVS